MIALSIGLIVGDVSGVISWKVTRFKRNCEFVGSEGCAVLRCEDSLDNIKVDKTFYFKNAWAVSTSMTRNYKGGSYKDTLYHFQWYAPETEQAIFLGWIYKDRKAPPAGDPYRFARAIESAWYTYLLPKLHAELTKNGHIGIFVGQKRWARVGPGFIEIVEKDGAVHRCEAGDIGSAKLASDTFDLARKTIAAGYTNTPWMARPPDLACLHDDPEFQQIWSAGPPKN